MTRATLVAGLVCWLIASVIGGCGRGEQREVVLYTSADDYLVREVVSAYERKSGVRVRVQGDTEATKTTGLVLRLLAEKANPRADVWWSSEPFGTIRLAREGVLERYVSAVSEADLGGKWPATLRARDEMWYGFGSRGRVIAYNTDLTPREDVPRTLRDLTDPKWAGRVGIARPQFGTTRGHVGALAMMCGEPALRAWLEAMKASGVRIYDGNATVVQAMARGEILLCLTDTDDVYAGQRNGWPVDLVYETLDESTPEGLCSFGPLVMPNTVALVRGAPNRDEGVALIDFLLSEEVERIMANSESRNAPVRPHVAAEFAQFAIPMLAEIDLYAVADAMDGAVAICEDVLGK